MTRTTRTTPLRARRLNIPGRDAPENGDRDGESSAAPVAADLDPDLAEMRKAFAENRLPQDLTPDAHYQPATTLSPSWLHDERDHEPAPADVAVADDDDEWDALRQSGERADERDKLKATREKSDKPTLTRTLLEIPVLVVVAALIAFVVRTFVAQAFYIPSGSMEPQLLINDRIVVSKLAYRLHDPRRGDIVVFENPNAGAQPQDQADDSPLPLRAVRAVGEAIGLVQPSTDDFIKRVIGLPGDVVESRDNKIFVNGRVLIEPYIQPEEITGPFKSFYMDNGERVEGPVPEGHLWVMGDNRDGSSDSRSFGPIKQSSIVGRTVVRVWPLGDASFL